jgi:hypothetical protein
MQFVFRVIHDLTDPELQEVFNPSSEDPEPIIWPNGQNFTRTNLFANVTGRAKTYQDGYLVQVYDEELKFKTPPEPWYSLLREHGFLEKVVDYVMSSDYSMAEAGDQTLTNRVVSFTLLVDVHQGLSPCPNFSAEQVYERTNKLLNHLIFKSSISRMFCLRVWDDHEDQRDWAGVMITPKPGQDPFPCNVRMQQLYVLPHAQGEMEAWKHSPTHDAINAQVFTPEEKWLHPQFGRYPGSMSNVELLAYAVRMGLLDLEGAFYDPEDHEQIAELYNQLDVDWQDLREHACELFEGQLGERVMAGTMESIFLDAFSYGTQQDDPGWSPSEWLGGTWIPAGVPHLAELYGVESLPNGCPLLVGWPGDDLGNTVNKFHTTITYNVALFVCE